jgi:hypothetical protein
MSASQHGTESHMLDAGAKDPESPNMRLLIDWRAQLDIVHNLLCMYSDKHTNSNVSLPSSWSQKHMYHT